MRDAAARTPRSAARDELRHIEIVAWLGAGRLALAGSGLVEARGHAAVRKTHIAKQALIAAVRNG